MSPADRCNQIIDLIDRVLAETAAPVRPKPAVMPVPVAVRPAHGK